LCKESAPADDVRAAMPHPRSWAARPTRSHWSRWTTSSSPRWSTTSYDALLTGDNTINPSAVGSRNCPSAQFEPGFTTSGLMAEHGFSALVTVRRGDTTTSVLFDTGLSPDAMVTNAGPARPRPVRRARPSAQPRPLRPRRRPGGLARRRATRSLPMVGPPAGVGPRRRLALPGGGADDWPTLSKRALTGEGFDVIEPPPAVPARRRLHPDHR